VAVTKYSFAVAANSSPIGWSGDSTTNRTIHHELQDTRY